MRLKTGLGTAMRRAATTSLWALASAALLAASTPVSAAADTAPRTEQRDEQRAERRRAPRPAIWLLEDSDTRIYLFGTIHILPRDYEWRSAALNRIIREADELVMETTEEGEADQDAFGESMFMRKSVPILSRVSTQYRERLQAVIDLSGMPVEMWDSLHTWAAGFMVMAVQIMAALGEGQADADDAAEPPMSGAEIVLTEEFRRAGKPISAVETTAQQMSFFRALSRPGQRAFLESMLEEAPPGTPGLGSGDDAWVSGDVESIARDMETFTPELYDVLLTRRNRAWTEWLAARLERPGTVLFAVGAGHLAGRDSVQTMLAGRGLTARRIH